MAKTTSDNVKVAAISVFGTIAVALIGIVPAVQSSNEKIAARDREIQSQKAEIEALKKQMVDRINELKPPYAIRGSVRNTSDNKPITDADLYVADPENQATLDDNGNFVVKNTFHRAYWLVMARQGGKILRLLINPTDPVNEAAGVAIRYTFAKE
jgi:hypothetical protein